MLAERSAGRDPQAAKQTSKRRIRSEQVGELAAEFIARHASRNRTGAETARIFNREVLPYWGSWTVGEVRKRYSETVETFLKSSAPLAKGTWYCLLTVNEIVTKRVAVRIT